MKILNIKTCEECNKTEQKHLGMCKFCFQKWLDKIFEVKGELWN